jgi:dolichol-phosphate mannosyltransferase
MWVTTKAYRAINALSDVDLPENMGDFKLLSRKVVDQLMNLKELDPYLRGIIRWIGFRQETVYYVRAPRFSGKTHFPLLGIGPIQEFIRGITSFSAAPLYACLIYGFVISLFAFVYLIVVVTTKLIGVNIPGWSAIMAAILFLGGNVLLTNGVLGLYIARIYNQIKERPRYIISDKIGFEEEKEEKTYLRVSWRKRKSTPA